MSEKTQWNEVQYSVAVEEEGIRESAKLISRLLLDAVRHSIELGIPQTKDAKEREIASCFLKYFDYSN